jgi:hypothetical protein
MIWKIGLITSYNGVKDKLYYQENAIPKIEKKQVCENIYVCNNCWDEIIKSIYLYTIYAF